VEDVYRKSIDGSQRVKRMKFCPACGVENDDSYNYCMKCRAYLPTIREIQNQSHPPIPVQPQPSMEPVPYPVQTPPSQMASYQPVQSSAPVPQQLQPHPSLTPHSPKIQVPKSLYAIGVVALILSATAFGLSMYSLFVKQPSSQEPPSSSGITMLELYYDHDLDPNRKGINFVSYNPGDIVTIVDVVNYVNYSKETIYGYGTKVYFNSGPGLYLQMEGDKRGDYTPGKEVKLIVHIANYKINNGEHTNEDLDEYPMMISVSYSSYFDMEKLQDGSYKLTYSDHPFEPSSLSNCSAKFNLDTYPTQQKVDSMDPLVAGGSSSGGKIRFYDANNSGAFDYGDYFMISGTKTSSKYDVNNYEFEMGSTSGMYCSGDYSRAFLLGWYK